MVRAGLNMIVVTNLSVKTKIINTLFIFFKKKSLQQYYSWTALRLLFRNHDFDKLSLRN